MVLYYGQAVLSDEDDIGIFVGLAPLPDEDDEDAKKELAGFVEPGVVALLSEDKDKDKFDLIYFEMSSLSAITDSNDTLAILKTPRSQEVRPFYNGNDLRLTSSSKSFLQKIIKAKQKTENERK